MSRKDTGKDKIMERPIYWHQGLFLQPQHFQLNDLFHQSLLRPFNKFICPHFWGVGEQEIQESALGTRSFNLLKGEYMFPDNSYVVFPGNTTVEARSFDESWIDGGKPFTVYVGIRKFSDVGDNVTLLTGLDSISEVTTRFVAIEDPEEFADLHGGGPKAQVKRLNYVLKIFWETELEHLNDYVLVPIAQLIRSGDELMLSKTFSPPALRISGSFPIYNLIKEIRDQVSARGHQLEQYKKERGIHSAEFGSRDMIYLLALRTLNRYVPMMYHLTETPQVHPWIVYGVLRQIIGELSAFSERMNMLAEQEDGHSLLPVYDHRKLYPCFSSAQAVITQLLDDITAGPEYVIELVYDGTYYTNELPPSIFEGKNRFYLVMDTEEDPKQMLASLEKVAKISSRETLPILIARALPGIKLEHLPVPPQELPRRTRSIYFQVNHHSDYWVQVEKTRNLAIYWDTAPDDLKVELMVVGKG
jgi:type VI secretion system protein ImpJ